MNFLKRSFDAVIYYKRNTLLNSLIAFLLFSLVLGAGMITRAAQSTLKAFQLSMEAVLQAIQTDAQIGEDAGLSLSECRQLEQETWVKSANYVRPDLGSLQDVSPVCTGAVETGDPGFFLFGTCTTEEMSRFEKGDCFLTEGEHLERSDRDCILLHTLLAKQNGLTVGSEVTVQGSDKSVRLTVRGLYDSKDTVITDDPLQTEANRVYITLDSLMEVSGGGNVREAYFTIQDPTRLDGLEERLRAVSTNPDKLELTRDDARYRQVAAPMEQMISIGQGVQWAAVAVSALTILLLTVLFLSRRGREMGVLISMGETKGKIFLQMELEMLITFLTGALLAILFAWLLLPALLAERLGSFFDLGLVGLAPAQILPVPGLCILLDLVSGSIVMIKLIRFMPRDILTEMDG